MIVPVKVIHTANTGIFDVPDRTRISEVRRSLAQVFNIPPDALPFLNGNRVFDDSYLSPQDVVEFIVSRGRKGSGKRVLLELHTSTFGTVDITNGVPSGLIHVTTPRVGLTCKRLRIEYAKALVGWTKVGSSYKPMTSGVVISDEDYSRLMEALGEKAKKRERQVAGLAILAALFTLNRRAKRCRDLAQIYYQKRMHGFAGEMKREKDRIYELKGQVLHHFVESGVLAVRKYHRFEQGNWAEVLEGEGYRFHRPCPPQVSDPEAEVIESIESKPKEASEPALDVAFEVVVKFLSGKDRVPVFEWPSKPREYRHRHWEDEEEDEWDYDNDSDDDE